MKESALEVHLVGSFRTLANYFPRQSTVTSPLETRQMMRFHQDNVDAFQMKPTETENDHWLRRETFTGLHIRSSVGQPGGRPISSISMPQSFEKCSWRVAPLQRAAHNRIRSESAQAQLHDHSECDPISSEMHEHSRILPTSVLAITMATGVHPQRSV